MWKVEDSLHSGPITSNSQIHIAVVVKLWMENLKDTFTQRCVNKHSIIQLSRSCSNMDSFHLLKTSQRMTFGNQFWYWSLMQGSRYKQNDVINHVTVSDKVQECWQWFHSMVPHVNKFNDKFLSQFVINDRHCQGTWLISKETTIICPLEMQF